MTPVSTTASHEDLSSNASNTSIASNASIVAITTDDSPDSSEQRHEPRQAYRARMACWILRIFVGTAGMLPYAEPGNPKLALIADITGVPELKNPAMTPDQVKTAMVQALNGLTQGLSAPHVPAVAHCRMRQTIDWLGRNAGLNPVEHDIFELGVALRVFSSLSHAVAHWGRLYHGDVIRAIAAILGHGEHDVAQACQPGSALLHGGLIRINAHDDTLDGLLKAPRELTQRISLDRVTPEDILAHLVVPMVKPKLGLADFAYMQVQNQLAQCWLEGVCSGDVSTSMTSTTDSASQIHHGGHLLVSGAPGLGKTQWVRALLAQASPPIQAMELVVLAHNGEPLSGQERLSHLRLTLRLMRHTHRAVIVFDEADDVFRSQAEIGAHSGGDSAAVSMGNHRASLNRLIEDSTVPVIWIMNHPDILDDAVLRRFDTVIAFANPSRSARLAMLGQTGLWQTSDTRRWADIAELTPALIDKLALTTDRAQRAGHPMDVALCEQWLKQRLPGKATRHLGLQATQAGVWNDQWVNASEDLLALAQGIKRCGSARILLYGPPGSGKTAYAHALAQMLDRPLLEQRASDLLSPYVGETEQRISQAFEQALDDKALLFLDEADSLLARREHAVRNWEVSQVNELLEQLGDFAGVVVLASNRMEALDAAVLRRLDAKIEFSALNVLQAQQCFVGWCQHLGFESTSEDLQALARLELLTPGDFACVARRLAFAPQVTAAHASAPETASTVAPVPDRTRAQTLLDLLAQELRFKSGGRRRMGFLAEPCGSELEGPTSAFQ